MSILKLTEYNLSELNIPRENWYTLGFINDGSGPKLGYVDDTGTFYEITGGGSGGTDSIGITINDGSSTKYMSGFKDVIESTETVNIPENYQYIVVSSLTEDGTINNNGTVSIL